MSSYRPAGFFGAGRSGYSPAIAPPAL